MKRKERVRLLEKNLEELYSMTKGDHDEDTAFAIRKVVKFNQTQYYNLTGRFYTPRREYGS